VSSRTPLARGPSVHDGLDLLGEVVSLGRERVPPEALAEAADVRTRGSQRIQRGEQVVVAALCGGTGSGKSSLFNEIAGVELSATGVRRPVTDDPVALIVGDEPGSASVLDWLGVRRRHRIPEREDLPAGLVLVDLPDHDSVVSGHREQVDAFVERVDVMVWVVDPLKYAQARLHDGYLARLAEHAEVVIVVMNRADELSREELEECVVDLRRLLAEDGLGRARLVATSARTGRGVDELRALLAEEARRKTATAQRIAADVRDVGRRLLAHTGPPVGARLRPEGVLEALAAAAGVGRVADAAGAEYRSAGREGSRPLVSMLLAALLALVLRPIRGARGLFTRPEPAATQPVTALPMQHALTALVDPVAEDLPPPWRDRLVAAAGGDSAGLSRAVGRAVDQVALRPPHRRWWGVLRVLLSVVELAAAAGFLWLVLLGVLRWLALPEPPLPAVAGRLPWPTALLLGGLAVRAVLGLARRRLLRRGAARHRRQVEDGLRDAVAEVAEAQIVRPLREELDAHDLLRDILERLAR
jgi:GTP-binding protein EngB required for normal cell division